MEFRLDKISHANAYLILIVSYSGLLAPVDDLMDIHWPRIGIYRGVQLPERHLRNAFPDSIWLFIMILRSYTKSHWKAWKTSVTRTPSAKHYCTRPTALGLGATTCKFVMRRHNGLSTLKELSIGDWKMHASMGGSLLSRGSFWTPKWKERALHSCLFIFDCGLDGLLAFEGDPQFAFRMDEITQCERSGGKFKTLKARFLTYGFQRTIWQVPGL